ncbi:MFS transporter [Actinomadura rupiterrae]|uniref:MFS transporter n=1 Tax=Actinomadura rupiterrae TaxID=559627 RepID=UPI0020A36899|nr:MFS transporter [Actinomadura rupiterrae]MCP2336253.1 MFS family permease [Actinomadura rupiterrae]
MAAAGSAVPERTAGEPGVHRRAWTVVALLVLFMAINFMDKVVLGLAGKHVRADLGLSDTAFGAIGSAFFLLFSVSGVAVGFVTDRIGARRLVGVLVALWSVSQLAVAVPGAGLAVLLGTRVTLGAAEGPAFGLASHTAFGWFPDRRRGLAANLLSVGAAAGVAVGGPLLAAVISGPGWRTAFALTGVLGLLWLLAWAKFGAEGPYNAQTSGGGRRGQERGDFRVPYRRLLTRPSILAGLACGFAGFWLLAVAITWMPQFMQRVHGYTLQDAGLLAAGTQVVGIGVILAFAAASQRILRRGGTGRAARGVLGGAAILVSGAALLLVSRIGGGAPLVLALMVAFTFAHPFFGFVQAAVAQIAPTRQRAAALGVVTAVASTAGAVGPAVTGALVDRAGSDAAGFQHAFDLTGVLLLIGGVLAVAFVNPERDSFQEGNTL